MNNNNIASLFSPSVDNLRVAFWRGGYLCNENIINLLFNLADVLSIILPVLLSIAFMTIIERKQLAAHQRRVGPVKCFGETLILGKTIKLRGHPKDNSTKLSLKPE